MNKFFPCTWMGDRRSAVHRSAERKVIPSETEDWGQNGGLYRHRFSAFFLCPRANTIQHGEHGYGYFLNEGGGGDSGGKKVKGENGKKGSGDV